MKNLNAYTNDIIVNDYTKRILFLKGYVSGQSALNLKNNIPQWFKRPLDEFLVDLSEADELDIIGINALVRFRMIAMQMNVQFSVKIPYKKRLVEHLESTKLAGPLNVEYVIQQVKAIPKAA